VGSSGLGWFSADQAKSELMERIVEVARDVQPFSFRFGSIERFPDSTVYYLAPLNEHPFHDFQRRLGASGLRFEATPYEYVPHCPIAILSAEAGKEAHAEVRACPVPAQIMDVVSVSFWSVDHHRNLAIQGERIDLGS